MEQVIHLNKGYNHSLWEIGGGANVINGQFIVCSSSEAPPNLSPGATEEESAPSRNPGEFEELGKKIKGLSTCVVPIFSLSHFFTSVFIAKPHIHSNYTLYNIVYRVR